ncbi:2-succinyl-6-hydroxy-2,4-cyclohexadiene-1-carboxylate synthase [Aggregatibacter kilianii]|uniref:2-succinyl-6-hydroxy-2, 4-cyclohexadiene-1-carboxylate synthase n=1 Tax=Aggregatibacter kilianii TaxID=2025884 RepID=UPI000D649D0F|nr:2-succinyl-6-hydroxy-2,4-cyclohexadiene-1-carboxylate synthase [Aggregatibacter kilianii]
MKPYLVFLHGLLGTQTDWQKLSENLPHFYCVALDLPWHGSAKHCHAQDFDDTCAYVAQQIQSAVKNQPYFLVGYSLGGRIALYYALYSQLDKYNLQGLIIEGGNLGLSDEQEKKVRWKNDVFWAQRFRTETPQSVLNDWYQQAVFAHLTEIQRKALIEQRQANCGDNIAQMLLATSLAKQPDLRPYVKNSPYPIYYFCGEQDDKFKHMAVENQLNLSIIPHAGHNAHQENPTAFAAQLNALLQDKSIAFSPRNG